METYVTVSRGEPGEEAVPLVASSDPEVVSEVMRILASFFRREGERVQMHRDGLETP